MDAITAFKTVVCPSLLSPSATATSLSEGLSLSSGAETVSVTTWSEALSAAGPEALFFGQAVITVAIAPAMVRAFMAGGIGAHIIVICGLGMSGPADKYCPGKQECLLKSPVGF